MLIESVLSLSWARFKGLTSPLLRVVLLPKVFLPGIFLLTIATAAPQALAEFGSNGKIAQLASTCSQPDLEQLLSRWRQFHVPAVSALRACGDSAVSGLIEVMVDESLELRVRQFSARALAQIGSAEAVGGLLAALRNETTQAIAFIGLGEINEDSEVAVTVLTAALRDELEIVQVGAAYGLAEIGPNAEAAIPELAELLRVSEREYLHPEEGSEARGMAAYALGQINPLHEEALKALGISTNLRSPIGNETIEYYPEQKEEVRAIASEALDEISDVLFLLNSDNRSYTWHIIALGHQSELIKNFNQILAEEADPDILSRILLFIGSFPHKFVNGNVQSNDFIDLSNHLLAIIENQGMSVGTKYSAVHSLAELYYFAYLVLQQNSYATDESVVSRLVQIAKNEEEDIEIRQGAVNALYALLERYELPYGTDYHNSLEKRNVVEALVELAKDSHLYSLWHEDYIQLQSQGIIDWNEIGVIAMAALLYSTDWSFCSDLAFPYQRCEENRASPAGVFLSQLNQANPVFFQALRQNAMLPASPYILSGADTPALAGSVIRHQSNNKSAVCRYGIAQRLVPRCR